jgi:hypothetical protein
MNLKEFLKLEKEYGHVSVSIKQETDRIGVDTEEYFDGYEMVFDVLVGLTDKETGEYTIYEDTANFDVINYSYNGELPTK